MKNQSVNDVLQEWKKSQQMQPLFDCNGTSSQLPLTFQDSMSFAPNFPFCALGTLSAEGNLDSKKGIAFVVEDNYLLTCASNVYSHVLGEYPNIIFTINSNRKQRCDTHKISKVIVPQQYKILPQNDRSHYNYALLYIQGKPMMKDKYGSLGMKFKDHNDRKATYFECAIDSESCLSLIGVHKFQISSDNNKVKQSNNRKHMTAQGLLMVVSGSPLLFQSYSGAQIAGGLILSSENSAKTSYILFDNAMCSLLAQKVKIRNGCLNLSNLTSEAQDLNYLREYKRIDIDQFYLFECNLNGKHNNFFQQLPISTVSSFCLYKVLPLDNDLSFLRLDKFKDIKMLFLFDSQIGPEGCQLIASIYFHDLRQLQLDWNPIGNQGCQHISKIQSPFIRVLSLAQCQFNNDGLGYIVQRKRNNLDFLNVDCNKFDNNVSAIFQQADFPRINRLSLQYIQTSGLYLRFLMFPSWKNLIHLYLNKSKIGRTGCKIIKQSGIALMILHISGCHIDCVGVKWLCKGNQSRLFLMSMYRNAIGDQGCLTLCKAHMPALRQVTLSENKMRIQGLKKLLQTGRNKPNMTFKHSKLDEFVDIASKKISNQVYQ